MSHFEAINLHKAKGGYGLTGDGSKVGIIDTGFNLTHDEFDGGSRTISTNCGCSLSSNSVSNYHGAVVAGIVGADDDGQGVEGVADEADKINCQMPADIITQSVNDKLKAFKYDFTTNNLHVVNQSFGLNTFNADDLDLYISSYPSNTVTELFQYALTDHYDDPNSNDGWIDLDGAIDSAV